MRCAAPGAVDALRARDAECVLARAHRTAAVARVEEVEPAVAADDARSFDEAVLPAGAAAEHDLAARPEQAHAVRCERLAPERARVLAAVLLPDEEGGAVHVVHHARV